MADNFDLSQSVLSELKKHGALDSIRAEQDRQNEQSLQELYANFYQLPKESIKKAFIENGNDFMKTCESLWKVLERHSVTERVNRLMETFQTLPKNLIEQTLEENEGDIEMTTDQLCNLVSVQEAQKERERQVERQKKEREQEQMRVQQLLRQRFSSELEEREINKVLQETNGNFKEATTRMNSLCVERKKNALQVQFPHVPEIEIMKTLSGCEYDKTRAASSLSKQFPPQQTKSLPIASPPVQKDLAALQKYEENLLNQSLVMGQELEDQIKREREQSQKEAKDLFKNQLNQVLAPQIRNGPLPGLNPPISVKEVNERISKKPGPIQVDEPIQNMNLKPVQQQENVLSESALSAPVRLTVTPSSVDIGNPVTVHYEFLSGQSSSSDWIGMFHLDKMNKDYVSYQYRGLGEKEGTVTFNPTEYGSFEFRYFPAGTMLKANYQHLAKSNIIRVGPNFTLSAQLSADSKKITAKWAKVSGNAYKSAWIGLYPQGADNNSWIHWEYATNPEVTFEAPVKPGVYELRFFANSYIQVATSEAISITGSDSLIVSVKETTIQVDCHVVSLDPYQSSAWVGFYCVDQPDNRQFVKYRHLKEHFQTLSFRYPKASGTYEVRLFANKSYDTLVKSGPFTVNV